MAKARLYIDVDDTLFAQTYKGFGYDLRPGVCSQLRILARIFDCKWLTCWPHTDKRFHHSLVDLMRNLYAGKLNNEISYADWGHGHEWRKAGYVLDPENPQDFWWLEDPLCHEEIEALKNAGKLDRYIRVEPHGHWGFLNGINELFKRAGITEAEIKRVGGKPEWFKQDYIQADGNDHGVRETLERVLLYTRNPDTAEEKIADIQRLVQSHLDILY